MNFPENKKIILFDGYCNMCDGVVKFLLKKDTHDVFRFASLQSEIGQQILKHIGIDNQKIDSVVLYVPNVAYFIKSDAALEIANELGVLYQLLGMFKIFPAKIRNIIYDYVAKNRYKWYGKKDSCMMPLKKS
jgi:predicted DCC family thiol-disulfide oxidoreductase YuxK